MPNKTFKSKNEKTTSYFEAAKDSHILNLKSLPKPHINIHIVKQYLRVKNKA